MMPTRLLENLEHLKADARADVMLWDGTGVPKERVALGWAVAHTLGKPIRPEDCVWVELENVAGAQMRRGEFYVEPASIEAALHIAVEHGWELAQRVLWHTHVNTDEPSTEDIAEFPVWLCSYGFVYNVHSGHTTLYNNSGMLSLLGSNRSSPIATG